MLVNAFWDFSREKRTFKAISSLRNKISVTGTFFLLLLSVAYKPLDLPHLVLVQKSADFAAFLVENKAVFINLKGKRAQIPLFTLWDCLKERVFYATLINESLYVYVSSLHFL